MMIKDPFGVFVPFSSNIRTDEFYCGLGIFVTRVCYRMGLKPPSINVYGGEIVVPSGNAAEFHVYPDGVSVELYRAESTYMALIYVLHELRHYWQYTHMPEEFMRWCGCDVNNPVAPEYNPMEVDAYNFCGFAPCNVPIEAPVWRSVDELRELCAEMRKTAPR